MARIVFVLAVLVGFTALFVAAAPTDCEDGSRYDGNVQTLANGDSGWTCSGDRFGAVRVDNGTATRTVVTIQSTENYISTLQHFLTGYVCPVILHRYGIGCFYDAEAAAVASMLNSAEFDEDAVHTYPGQVGLCFYITDEVQIQGLRSPASTVALAVRNGHYNRCTVSQYTVRTFLATIWLGVAFLLPILAGVGLALAYILGIGPVAVVLSVLGAICGCKK